MDVVLAHSGLTDAGEWDDVAALLAREHRVVTVDLWQDRPLRDIVLDAIPGERAALVGTSMGGRAALEAAAAAPKRVAALVLIGTNPFGWSEELQAIGAEEEALFEAGRLDEAARLMVTAWLVGPSRLEEDVPLALRERVFAMQRKIYELPYASRGEFDVDAIAAPMAYVRGELDWPDVARAAARFDRAEQHVVPGAAHLVTMERPEAIAAIVSQFLAHT
jgi:3-oxoadipate enol-lactonase